MFDVVPDLPIFAIYAIADGSAHVSDAVISAARTVLSPTNLVLIFLGAMLGLIIGVIPGVGGPIALALLIPLTFGLDPEIAFMILTATLGGTAFGGSVTAILLNVPGDAPNAATLIDGYPMSRQGRAGEALAASSLASCSGALIGVLLLVLTIPFVRQIALQFTSPEMFWLALFGLLAIAVATRGSVITDLIAGLFGLMLAFHGLNPVTGTARFTWGTEYLLEGIQLIPLLIGLFAIAEMVRLEGRQETIATVESIEGDIRDGITAIANNRPLVLRGSIIGWVIGLIPGAGGTVANFISYLQAKHTVQEPNRFGEGDVRGVIASEAANDAKDGGSLVPTLGLGIPGSASTAVLLGAFVVHGITPGPELFENHLYLVFVIAFSLVLANVFTSMVGLLAVDVLRSITRMSFDVIVPTVIVFGLLGAYSVRGNMGDLSLAIAFGIFGLFLIKYDVSRISIILAIILGPIAEENFHRALQVSRGDYSIFYTRTASLVIIFAMIALILVVLHQSLRNRFGT